MNKDNQHYYKFNKSPEKTILRVAEKHIQETSAKLCVDPNFYEKLKMFDESSINYITTITAEVTDKELHRESENEEEFEESDGIPVLDFLNVFNEDNHMETITLDDDLGLDVIDNIAII